MAITYEIVKSVTAQLYEQSLKKIPEDTKAALRKAEQTETNSVGRNTLRIMLDSAEAAESRSPFVCSDAGIPVYSVKIGTRVQFEGNIKQAIVDGFDQL